MARILVIDDMAIFRDPLASSLRLAGYETDAATNGREGLARAKAARPDMILLDVSMPVMDGLEFVAAMRKESSLADVPVVLLTALTDRQTVVKAAQLGIKDYLLKSRFSMSEMLERVVKYVGQPGAKGQRPKPIAPPAVVKPAMAAAAATPQPPENKATMWEGIPQLLTREQCLSRLESALETKTMSGVVSQVISLASSPRADLTELASTVSRDAVLSARVLRAANSSGYGGGRKIVTTIPDAVRNIGSTQVRNLAMALGVFDVMPAERADGYNPIRDWQHSFAAAILCEHLVGANSEDSGVAYLVGLCHDLGRILFNTQFGAEYAAVLKVRADTGRTIDQIERHILGTSQADLAKVILTKLGLPDRIRAPIEEYHGTLSHPGRLPTLALARSLRLADLYANGMMMAASPSAETGPVTKAECRAVVGNTDPPPPDGDGIRCQILALTDLLGRFSGSERDKLSQPLLTPTERKVAYIRDAALSKFDPLEAALSTLAKVQRVETVEAALAAGDFSALVIASHRPRPLAVKPPVPVLRVVLDISTREADECGPTVSLERLAGFLSGTG